MQLVLPDASSLQSLLNSVKLQKLRSSPPAACVASEEILSHNAPAEVTSIRAGLAPISKPPWTKTKTQQLPDRNSVRKNVRDFLKIA